MIELNKDKIYITHCCAKKNNEFKGTRVRTTADALYVATPTQRFMQACKSKKVDWAIFSDNYGVWLYPIKHQWYEKNPNEVTDTEFNILLKEFDESLEGYKEICFYYNPGRFHPLYRKLISKSKLKERIKEFTHISEIN